MKASLVLCSKNGGERLQKCLQAIAALDGVRDLQLVLVDNGSTDGRSPAIMQAFARAGSCDCVVMEEKAPGNSAGRNTGIRAASGDLLLFIDDDCYPEPGFLQEWRAIFARRDAPGFATGMIHRFNPDASELGCNESVRERVFPAGRFVPRGAVQGSNMVFRRDCLGKAGMFDPRFGAGTVFAGEEWDLVLRASAAGFHGGYFPRPQVLHDHQRSGDVAHDRLLYYDYGAGAVYAKHVRMRGPAVIGLHFLRDIYRQRADRERRAALWRGYRAFARLSGGAT